MKIQPFSIATIGSTDMDSIKLYPVLIKIFDTSLGQVTTELLEIRECAERSTGENTFKLLDITLSSKEISWKNCVSFGTGNALVMTGKHKGAFITRKKPNIYISGCTCHLISS